MVLIDRPAGDPSTVVEQMVAELRAMSKGRLLFHSPELVRKRLRSLGPKLWADVVPDAIREHSGLSATVSGCSLSPAA
jgi:hypothetical protein